MKISYPHTIQNCVGEKIIFKELTQKDGRSVVYLEAFCEPGCGPAMHTHLKQDESLTVISGKLAYQTPGNPVKFALPGESVLFKAGTPHKFWADGNQRLHCSGWISPVNSVVYFLTALYQAQNKSGKAQPDSFEGAYLLTHYKSEYDMPEIPSFVKNIIMPFTVLIGKLTGKYKHFADAPPAV